MLGGIAAVRASLAAAALLLCGVRCDAQARAPQLIELALPDGLVQSEAAGRVLHNGVALTTARLRSTRPPEQLLSQCAALWREAVGVGDLPSRQPVAGPHTLGDWRVLTQLRNDWHYTLQLKSDGAGGSIGWLSALPLLAPRQSVPTPQLPLPAGTTVTSVVQSADQPAAAAQFLAQSRQPPASLARAISERAHLDGWQSLYEQQTAAGIRQEWQRGAWSMAVWLMPAARGTALVLLQTRAEPGAP